MNRRLILSSALLFAGALACGGSDAATAPNTDNGKSACSITLSGAASGALNCSDFSADGSNFNNETGVGFQGGDAAGDTLLVALGFSGAPVARTYVASELSPVLGFFTGKAVWTASPGVGDVSLTITSVKTLNSGAGLTSYEIHGTMSATLAPAAGASTGGPVRVAATF